MRQHLRLFTGEEHDSLAVESPKISISFGEFSQILLEACRHQRSFLRDFQEDEIQLTEDLYQVLTAYCRLRPGA